MLVSEIEMGISDQHDGIIEDDPKHSLGEKFIEILLKDNKINEFLTEKEIKKLLTNDDLKESIDWMYNNKFKI